MQHVSPAPRRQHYSAERMSLVILGGQDLDTLGAWSEELFAGVPSGRGPSPDFSNAGLPFQARPRMSHQGLSGTIGLKLHSRISNHGLRGTTGKDWSSSQGVHSCRGPGLDIFSSGLPSRRKRFRVFAEVMRQIWKYRNS